MYVTPSSDTTFFLRSVTFLVWSNSLSTKERIFFANFMSSSIRAAFMFYRTRSNLNCLVILSCSSVVKKAICFMSLDGDSTLRYRTTCFIVGRHRQTAQITRGEKQDSLSTRKLCLHFLRASLFAEKAIHDSFY